MGRRARGDDREEIYTQELIGLDTQIAGLEGTSSASSSANAPSTQDASRAAAAGGGAGAALASGGSAAASASVRGRRVGGSRGGSQGGSISASWKCILAIIAILAILFAAIVLIVEHWYEEDESDHAHNLHNAIAARQKLYHSAGSTMALPRIFQVGKLGTTMGGGNRPILQHLMGNGGETVAEDPLFDEENWEEDEEVLQVFWYERRHIVPLTTRCSSSVQAAESAKTHPPQLGAQQSSATGSRSSLKPRLNPEAALVPDYDSLPPSALDTPRATRFSLAKSAKRLLAEVARTKSIPLAVKTMMEGFQTLAKGRLRVDVYDYGKSNAAARTTASAVTMRPGANANAREAMANGAGPSRNGASETGGSPSSVTPAPGGAPGSAVTDVEAISRVANIRVEFLTPPPTTTSSGKSGSSTKIVEDSAKIGLLALYPTTGAASLAEPDEEEHFSHAALPGSSGKEIPPEMAHVVLLVALLEILATERPALQSSVVVHLSPDTRKPDVGLDRLLADGLLPTPSTRPLLYLHGSGGHPVCGATSTLFWKLDAVGQLVPSGRPQEGINALELTSTSLEKLQNVFYATLGNRFQIDDRRYGFEVSSSMKPTHVNCDGGGDTIPGHCVTFGDVRLSPFQDVEEARRKLETFAARLNEHVERLPGRGPYSRYVLKPEKPAAPTANRVGRLDFTWVFDRDHAKQYEGFVCDVKPSGHRALVQATRDMYGASYPHAIGGSIRYAKMLQNFGIQDLQVVGFEDMGGAGRADGGASGRSFAGGPGEARAGGSRLTQGGGQQHTLPGESSASPSSSSSSGIFGSLFGSFSAAPPEPEPQLKEGLLVLIRYISLIDVHRREEPEDGLVAH